MKSIIIFFALLFLTGTNLFSQNFNGGIIGGASATQISGDQLAGFNKSGLNIGAFVNLNTNKYSSWQMELKYIQKGSRKNVSKSDTTAESRYIYRLRLNYIEIPVLFKYDLKGLSKFASDTSYHLINKLSFEIGLAYAVLVGSSEEDAVMSKTLYSPPFNKGDLSVLAGFYYEISDNVKLNFRWTGSILPVRKHSGGATFRLNRGQYNDVLELSLHIQFNKQKRQ